jgi:hypothetical protein
MTTGRSCAAERYMLKRILRVRTNPRTNMYRIAWGGKTLSHRLAPSTVKSIYPALHTPQTHKPAQLAENRELISGSSQEYIP